MARFWTADVIPNNSADMQPCGLVGVVLMVTTAVLYLGWLTCIGTRWVGRGGIFATRDRHSHTPPGRAVLAGMPATTTAARVEQDPARKKMEDLAKECDQLKQALNEANSAVEVWQSRLREETILRGKLEGTLDDFKKQVAERNQQIREIQNAMNEELMRTKRIQNSHEKVSNSLEECQSALTYEIASRKAAQTALEQCQAMWKADKLNHIKMISESRMLLEESLAAQRFSEARLQTYEGVEQAIRETVSVVLTQAEFNMDSLKDEDNPMREHEMLPIHGHVVGLIQAFELERRTTVRSIADLKDMMNEFRDIVLEITRVHKLSYSLQVQLKRGVETLCGKIAAEEARQVSLNKLDISLKEQLRKIYNTFAELTKQHNTSVAVATAVAAFAAATAASAQNNSPVQENSSEPPESEKSLDRKSTLKIMQVHPEGKYIRIINVSPFKDQDISSFTIRQTSQSNKLLAIFQFPPKTILKAATYTTVYSSSGAGEFNQPFDWVWKDLARWETGQEITTVICNTQGDILASSEDSSTPRIPNEETSEVFEVSINTSQTTTLEPINGDGDSSQPSPTSPERSVTTMENSKNEHPLTRTLRKPGKEVPNIKKSNTTKNSYTEKYLAATSSSSTGKKAVPNSSAAGPGGTSK